jgi:mono/diheme cytochrome c family protein
MQLRKLAARYCELPMILITVISALLFCAPELLAGETRSPAAEPEPPIAAALGVHFVEGSTSSLILERDGKRYLVDLATQTVTAADPVQVASADQQQAPAARPGAAGNPGATIFQQQCASCHGADGKGLSSSNTPDFTNFRARSGIPTTRIVDVITNGRSGTMMQGFAGKLSATEINDVAAYVQSLAAQGERKDIYLAPDDFVYSLPTGRAVPKGAVYINFTHRFAYDPAFSGPGLGNTLFGLDGYAISSFGLRFGVTDKLSVSVYRSPSIIHRPIEFLAAYNVLDESNGHPFNASFRVSIDGQDNFRKNFTTNFEGVVSRSFSDRAQLYVVPTLSLDNRRLITTPGTLASRPPDLPGINSFSIGAGLAVNIRPTVAIVAEGIPTLANGDDLGIHRPSYAFGIQKRISGHAFTLGFGNGPGTVVAQRAGTRATLLDDPSADTPKGLFIGFNLMRRLR